MDIYTQIQELEKALLAQTGAMTVQRVCDYNRWLYLPPSEQNEPKGESLQIETLFLKKESRFNNHTILWEEKDGVIYYSIWWNRAAL